MRYVSRFRRAFGAFAADLADLDAATLVETLPGFHDLSGRAAAFHAGRSE